MALQQKIDIIFNQNKADDKHELSPLRVKIYKTGLDIMTYLTQGPVELQQKAIEKELRDKEFMTEYDIDLSQFITDVQLNQSVSGSYDSLQVQLKLSQSAFNYYFGDGLAQVNTGMMITLQRPAYHLSFAHEASSTPNVAFNITNDNLKVIESIDFGKSGKTKNQSVNPPKIKDIIDNMSRPSAVKNSTDEYIKNILQQINQREKEILENHENRTNNINDPAKKLTYTCIFLGFITKISKSFSVNGEGNHIVDISLGCESFLYPFMNNEFLFNLPELKYSLTNVEENGSVEAQVTYPNANDFYPINNPQNYDIDKLDVLNNWTKTPNDWIGFSNAFASDKNIIEGEKDGFINIRGFIKKMIRTFGQNVMPIGLQSPLNKGKNSPLEVIDTATGKTVNNNGEIFDSITNKILNPKGWLKLGMLVNVITEQKHLPKSCVYRQFLPINATTATTIRGGLKNVYNDTSVLVPWSLIYGTFVPDPALYDCFPIMIPLDNYSELQLLKNIKNSIDEIKIAYRGDTDKYPEFNPNIEVQSIYDFYKLIGGIPCIVYRFKLLDPEFSLNENTYKSLVAEHYLAHYIYGQETFMDNHYSEENKAKWSKATRQERDEIAYKNFSNARLYRQLQTIYRNHDFMSQKINVMPWGDIIPGVSEDIGGYKINQDSCLANKIPYLDFKDIKNFITNYDDNEKVNLIWMANTSGHIGLGNEYDIGPQAIINWYNVIIHGIHMLKIENPFVSLNDKAIPGHSLAIAERLYSIYNESNKRATGTITVNMQIAPDICKGGWLRIRMNRDFNDPTKYDYAEQVAEYYRKFFDFYCYVESINSIYTIDGNGNLLVTNTIEFSRGKFGLIPTTWPEIIHSNRTNLKPDTVDTQATNAQVEAAQNSVSPVEKAAQQAQQIDKPKDGQNTKLPPTTETDNVKQWLEQDTDTPTPKTGANKKSNKTNKKPQTTKNKVKK